MRQRYCLIALFAFLLVNQPLLGAQTSDTPSLSLASVIQQGRAHLEQQDYKDAFYSFKQHESQYAGQPQFDYWYGVAALRQGLPTEAVTALERVVEKQPQHAGARLELVAAYIHLNQFDSAEQELNYLAGLNAPPRAQAAMERFRDLIAQRRTAASKNPNLFTLSLDVGYDSNYLNYPDSFDLFANTILAGLAILEADSTQYTNLRGLAWQRWNSKQDSFIEASLYGQMRKNSNQEARIFDTHLIHGAVSFGNNIANRNELSFGLEASQLWLDGTAYRTHTGLNVRWQIPLDATNEFKLNAAFREFRFHERRNDYISWSADIEWRHALHQNVLLRSKTGIDIEKVTQEASREGRDANKFFVSLHVDFYLNSSQQLLTTLGYEQHSYHHEGFALYNHGQAALRKDNGIRGRLEWVYTPTRHWRFSLFGQYRDQTSSINFFALDQSLLQGSVTYVF